MTKKSKPKFTGGFSDPLDSDGWAEMPPGLPDDWEPPDEWDQLPPDEWNRWMQDMEDSTPPLDLQKYKRVHKELVRDTADLLPKIGPLDDAAKKNLADVVAAYKATALIGASGQGGSFNEAVVTAMASNVDEPAILPMSNPTSISVAVPADVLKWSDGRALIATGSPFEAVTLSSRTQTIGQANNVFVFPGIGLGAIISGATQITDGMISASATALAQSDFPQPWTPNNNSPRGTGSPKCRASSVNARRRSASQRLSSPRPPTSPRSEGDS